MFFFKYSWGEIRTLGPPQKKKKIFEKIWSKFNTSKAISRLFFQKLKFGINLCWKRSRWSQKFITLDFLHKNVTFTLFMIFLSWKDLSMRQDHDLVKIMILPHSPTQKTSSKCMYRGLLKFKIKWKKINLTELTFNLAFLAS